MKDLSKIILEQVENYNELLDDKVDTSAGNDTVLFGRSGVLDSTDFVSLMIDIEQAVEDEFGKHIVISSEKAMSQKNSPFRTVGTLSEYIEKLLEE